MHGLLVSFFVSFILCHIFIRSIKLHGDLTGDHDVLGPQKFHTVSVPRIGGLGIAAGITSAILSRQILQHTGTGFDSTLLLCAAPVFAVGLTEDFTKRVTISFRAGVIAIGALMAARLLGCTISHLEVPGVDALLAVPALSLAFTVFAITGLANAYNIIDGFNGLSSMVGMIALLALGYVAVTVHDSQITYLSFTMASAILGFFVWNYPRGLIFLGDGGAYLIGFWIAVLSILIVLRHDEISSWVALLINGYPIIETLFTIYRRWIHQGKNPGHPDGIHFHSLIYRRLLNNRCAPLTSDSSLSSTKLIFNSNSRTSPYLWVLSSLSVVPAVLWWQTTWLLMLSALVFTLFYLWLYASIVRFKTPQWMHPLW